MAANTSVLSIEKWLEGIDASLKKYSADFARLDFVNTNSVKYFNSADFALFRVPVSEAHRRMIINNVAKLQTPRSNLGLEDVAKATEPTPSKILFSPKNYSMKSTDHLRILETTMPK